MLLIWESNQLPGVTEWKYKCSGVPKYRYIYIQLLYRGKPIENHIAASGFINLCFSHSLYILGLPLEDAVNFDEK